VLFLALIYNYLYIHPMYNPIRGGGWVLEEARDLLSGDVKAIFQIAESNLGALSTVELGPKRHLMKREAGGQGEFLLCPQGKAASPRFMGVIVLGDVC
jgi:hypothetical protein